MKKYCLLIAVFVLGLSFTLNSQAAEVYKAGRGGNTSGQMLSRINNDVLARNPTTTLVLAGTNDFLNIPKLTSLQDFESNLREIVDRVLDSGSNVVMMTIPAIDEAEWISRQTEETLRLYEPDGPQADLIEGNEVIAEIAAEKGVALVDIFTLFINNPNFLSSDGVHQTDDGSRAMANLLYNSIVENEYSVDRVVLLGDSITNRYDDFFIQALEDNPIDTDGTTVTPDRPTTNNGTVVQIIKRNASGFAIDGGLGGFNSQNVTLSAASKSDEGQLWVELDRGNGYYSYEKLGTNFSLDGNHGGARNQSVYLWQTNSSNQNQQWQKVAVDGDEGTYQLVKRNGNGFAINGGSGAVEGRDVNLWSSGSSSQNLQWFIRPIATEIRLEAEDYDLMFGTLSENSSEGGLNIGFINDGDWLRFDNIDLTGVTTMAARVATRTAGGTLEVRLGSTNGQLIGSIDVNNTGGYQNWTTLNTSIDNVGATTANVYLVFRGGNGFLFNVNWIEFNPAQ